MIILFSSGTLQQLHQSEKWSKSSFCIWRSAGSQTRLSAISSSNKFQQLSLSFAGAFGGRIDHTLSNINTLYTHQHLPLVLCGENSLARLIPKGQTTIKPDLTSEGPECSVIALGETATASSRGLKWDLGAPLLYKQTSLFPVRLTRLQAACKYIFTLWTWAHAKWDVS